MSLLDRLSFDEQYCLVENELNRSEEVKVHCSSKQVSYTGHVLFDLSIPKDRLVKQLVCSLSDAKKKTSARFIYEENSSGHLGKKKVGLQFLCDDRDLANTFRPFALGIISTFR